MCYPNVHAADLDHGGDVTSFMIQHASVVSLAQHFSFSRSPYLSRVVDTAQAHGKNRPAAAVVAAAAE